MNTIDRLRLADPAATVPDYDLAETSLLLARATRPAPRGRRVALLAMAACLALVFAMMPVWWPRTGATARASDLLDRASVAAYDPPARPDQYWRITTRSITSDIVGEGGWGDPDTVSVLRWMSRVQYLAVDGSRPSWFVDRTGPFVRQVSGPATELPKAGWGEPDVWTTNLIPGQLSPAPWETLPSDPDALRARLYQLAHGRGQSPDGEVVVIIADALRSGGIPAPVRQAMFKVLKTVPGIDLGKDPVTLDGRKGITLGRFESVGEFRQELVFDPDDASLIGERSVFTNLPGDPALETSVTRVLVDSVPGSVRQVARHEHCQVEADGSTTCSAR